MSGTVEVDDSSLAPTASSIPIGRGMETAFLMVGLQALVRPLLLCVFACVCVCLWERRRVLQDRVLFVVGVTGSKTKKCVCELRVNFNCLLHALVLIQHLLLQQGCYGTQGPLCTVHLLLAAIQTL